LLTLPSETVPGTPVSAVLDLPDAVLDLEITPNRPDCLSLLGLARELGALYDLPHRRPAVELTEQGRPVADWAQVTVADNERCPHYTARVLTNVTVAPSPAWLQRRLERAGVRSINNVVDITNYVMLETGQPLHAFDYDLLAGGRIVVRRAAADEKLTTLDGLKRVLTPDMLVIADGEKAVALAGIMGGADSEIRAATRTVLLESAIFAPDPIRRTARGLGLSSESARRYERGVDPAQAEWASRRAAALLAQWAGAQAAPGVLDVFPAPPAPVEITCRRGRLETLLGLPAATADLARAFTRLGIEVLTQDQDAVTVRVPSFRPDLTREVDLIEEYARLDGLDRIPATPPRSTIIPGAADAPSALRRDRVRQILVALGLREAMNYSLTTAATLDPFAPDPDQRRITLPHPISQDQSVLRTTLLPQLAATLAHNRGRQIETAALFELGRVYRLDAAGTPTEEEHVALGLLGPVGRPPVERRRPLAPAEAFLALKGILTECLQALGVTDWQAEPTAAPWAQPGTALRLTCQGATLGLLGLVTDEWRQRQRVSDPLALAELCLDGLPATAPRVTVAPPPAQPAIRRDVALWASAGVTHAAITACIRAHAPAELEQIELFDVFADPERERRSLAYALTFRAVDRTLTDEQANAFHEAIKTGLQTDLALELRT
ncbi:MAG: phenylalanine--tRNA ligase subunit beta, partial [Candidatus Marinimicrobia bacterium]|nr:phenylalanine--tRNA ligase subunit beta [Candidatus Neomarinimicrobiota bacterium]